ncbi:hypothetical protein [Oleiagrimonas citrea]|uniref:hypothetical protein n=1 Tax=Oleiagrimonas citrea TaxID=1665687 RepID=UPI00196427DC|nr:hypothetical protein [Oleiagrimonas citrea]
MNSNRIPPAASAAELLRDLGVARSGPSTARKSGAESKAGEGASNSEAMRDLRGRIARSVEGVDLDDAASVARARQAAIREILLWEFGDRLSEDPEFGALQDAVEAAMQSGRIGTERFLDMVRALRKN